VVICSSTIGKTDLEDFFGFPYTDFLALLNTRNTNNGWILKIAEGWWTVSSNPSGLL